jgi:hypothetical protein
VSAETTLNYQLSVRRGAGSVREADRAPLRRARGAIEARGKEAS